MIQRAPTLDGIRGVAIILVLAGHVVANFQPLSEDSRLWLGGFANAGAGVRLFFVLSGYLITQLLLRELKDTGTISLRKFYARRMLRIFPAFYVYLAVLAGITVWQTSTLDTHAFIAAGSFAWNYFLAATQVSNTWNLGHLWTLALEQQFYLFWPALLLRVGESRAAAIALGLVIWCPVARVATYFLFPHLRGYLGMMFHTSVDPLMAGCLAALALQSVRTRSWIIAHRTAGTTIAWLWLLVLSPTAALLIRGFPVALGFTLDAIAACLVVGCAHYAPSVAEQRFLGRGILPALGIVSYSLYLWQQIALSPNGGLQRGQILPPLSLALALAILSYLFIERPLMNAKKRFVQPAVQPAIWIEMNGRSETPGLTRDSLVGDVALAVRAVLKKSIGPIAILLLLVSVVLYFDRQPGAIAFGMIAFGSCLVLNVWRHHGVGLPLVPLVALQTLVAYGLPIVMSNPSVMVYPEPLLTEAGVEILTFCCSLAIWWRLGMQFFHLSHTRSHAIEGFDHEGGEKLARLGFRLLVTATCYQLARSLDLVDWLLEMLPVGAGSIVNVLVSALSACGFFLVAMAIGHGGVSLGGRLIFWACLILNCYLSAASFLLSTTTTVIFSVGIGLFWGSGRAPWRFMLTVVAVLSFLNLGKFAMRERYWPQTADEQIPQFKFLEMPRYYGEWLDASYDALLGAKDERTSFGSTAFTRFGPSKSAKSGQNIFDRINNLQNILYVIDAVTVDRIEPLWGSTYTLVPRLLVPRLLWPAKPRTHEGQIILNVHFGRQDAGSTHTTYVAWGLLAEAYGNFGSITGSILLGVVLGLSFAWAEKFFARKLLLSMEGFIAFTLFLSIASSFEMVSSILVTSTFQALVPVVIACWPFVQPVTPVSADA